MDNLFLTQHFDWSGPKSGKLARVNRWLARLGARFRLTAAGDSGRQNSVEQRINLFHLVEQVLTYRVPGELVEIGAHEGSTAAVMQAVNDRQERPRELHVFDAFWGTRPEVLLDQLHRLGLSQPTVHVGRAEDTVPAKLPERIAFAHIDLGWGQRSAEHRDVLLHCLEAVYPRLALGGVCLLADSCEPDGYSRRRFSEPAAVAPSRHWNPYPAVKEACDRFFADKAETVVPLFGGPYSHGYVRKSLPAERWWNFPPAARRSVALTGAQ